MNMNSHPHPRDANVKSLTETLHRERDAHRRENFIDRGIGTLQDRYTTMDELSTLCDQFMKNNDGPGLRNKLAQLNCNFMTLRGELARKMELPDLFSIDLDNEGDGECKALIAVLMNGKTNQFGRIEFAATLRNKIVKVCPIGKSSMIYFTIQ